MTVSSRQADLEAITVKRNRDGSISIAIPARAVVYWRQIYNMDAVKDAIWKELEPVLRPRTALAKPRAQRKSKA